MNQPVEQSDAIERARRALREGRLGVVESECRRILKSSPDNVEAWRLVALSAWRNGHMDKAAEIMRRVVQLAPSDYTYRELLGRLYLALRDWRNAYPIYHRLYEERPSPEYENALGKCEWGLGDYQNALERFERAALQEPENPRLQTVLAQANLTLWRWTEARDVLERSVRAGIGNAMIWLLLARLKYREVGAEGVLPLLRRAVQADDATAYTFLNHAAFLKLAGRPEAAKDEFRRVPENPRFEAQWESLSFALEYREEATICGFAGELMELAIHAATVEGLTMEFGVYHGRSLRLIAERIDTMVHGFDSFQGLPEDWTESERAGSYSTKGRKPRLPKNVELHEGWFSESLPSFMDAHPDAVRLAHIDCDLYSSTRTVLEHMGPRLRKGSILVFDDFLGYPGWRDHEFRAFEEYCEEEAIQARYLAFNVLERQVAIQITGRKPT